jgi:hypothetical protein
LYRGELKVIESPNPLAEKLTLRHSGDFAGSPDEFEFEWRTLPPVDGLPSTLPPEQWVQVQASPPPALAPWTSPSPVPALYAERQLFHRSLSPDQRPHALRIRFSAWTAPMLPKAGSKRVLAGIGPFEQRIQDYQDTQVNTIVSMISQAGARAVGDVALNLEAVNSAGLIEVYETILRRGLA